MVQTAGAMPAKAKSPSPIAAAVKLNLCPQFHVMSAMLCYVMCAMFFFLLLLICWVCNFLNHCCLLCLMYQSNVCIIVMSFLCSLFFLSYLPVSSVVYYQFFLNLVLVWSSTFSLTYVFLCRGGGELPIFQIGIDPAWYGDSLMHWYT